MKALRRFHVVIYVEAPLCRDIHEAIDAAHATLASRNGRVTVGKIKEAPSGAQ